MKSLGPAQQIDAIGEVPDSCSRAQSKTVERKVGNWAVPLAIVSMMALGDRAFAGNEIYGYVGPGGTLEMTNVPADDRFKPAETKVRRHHRRASAEEVEEAVERYAWQYQLHPALLLAVIKAESDFNPTVISRAGAVGLMQLIPETAIRHGVRNLYDTDDNIRGGARHLRYLLDRFNGNVRLAVAAYNAGERRVERYRAIPPYQETRDYVRKVMTYYKSFRGNYQTSPGTAVVLAIQHKPLQLQPIGTSLSYGKSTAPPVK